MSRLVTIDVDPTTPEDQKEVLEAALALVTKGGYDVPAAADEMKSLTKAVKAWVLEARMREVRRRVTSGIYPQSTAVLTMGIGTAHNMLADLPRTFATGDLFDEFNRECVRLGRPELRYLRVDEEVPAQSPGSEEEGQ